MLQPHRPPLAVVARLRELQILRKEPNDGLVQTLESGEMNGEFSVKLALVLEVA
jgi:hypothetical protein